MPVSYDFAPSDVPAIGQTLIEQYYPDLLEAGVTINYLFATAGDGGGPAVKHGGYPADAIVKVNNLKDRVEGKGDCTVTIDGDQWPDWSDEERRALIDHEVYHLEVKRHKKGEQAGEIKTDSAGRPMLKLKRHDWQLGGFDEIARRHGESSGEYRAAKVLFEEMRQLSFSGF